MKPNGENIQMRWVACLVNAAKDQFSKSRIVGCLFYFK